MKEKLKQEIIDVKSPAPVRDVSAKGVKKYHNEKRSRTKEQKEKRRPRLNPRI